MTSNTASHEAGDDHAAPVRAGEVVADKYLIGRTLGIGGMGVVVAARDQLLDRRVAIKFLLPKLAGSETAVQRFLREARAATRVTSEHVVRLLEIEKLPSGTPFFVMEYLEGSDLRALLRERGALSPSLAVDYVLQAAQAVAEGHVKGIVHRDIKPGNLFLTQRADGSALIKVLDFGIAKTIESDAAESSLTSSDDVRLGSPAYMPPEQLQNPRDVDKRSDIWSLGATLYELLCGRPPFEGPGYLELASRILSKPPAPLSAQKLPGTLPAGLEGVVLRCLEKDREVRYANAFELATALAPFGSDDARMSLTRVTGVAASESSIPALTRSVSLEAGGCETTLEVPGAASPNANAADERRTSNIGAIASTPAPPQKRGRLLFGAVALAALAGVYGWSRSQHVAVGPVAVSAPVVAERGETAAGPKPAVAAESLAAPPSSDPSVVVTPTKVSTTPVTSTAAHVARRAVRNAAVEPALTAAPVPAPSKAALALPKVDVPAAAGPEAPAGLGRSAEIERLIEARH